MTSPVDIRPDHLGIVQDILIKNLPAGVKVWVFGSRANWTTKDSSDLDLALEGEGKLSHKVLGALKDAFEDSSLPYTVDVVDFNRIGDAFKQIVELQRTPLPPISRSLGMEGEWVKTTLSNIGEVITGRTPATHRQDFFGGDIPFVTPSDFDGRRLIGVTNRYLTEAGAKSVESARIPRNSIMVTCIGSAMGKSAIADNDCVTNQQINSIVVDSEIDAKYVYYDLHSREAEIRNMASGSAQPILKKSSFGLLNIVLPPLPEQRAIAHILGTLDDKIELNRRMNETLEAMARALFKSWFVDFDPVRAKMEGRDTGLPPHIADLFPDRLAPSELGQIPEGWEIKPLDKIAHFRNGLALQKFRPEEGKEWLPVLKIAQLRAGIADGKERASTDIRPDCIVDDGDVIFSWSGSLLVKVWFGGRVALNQHLFKVTSEEFPKWFFLQNLRSHLAFFQSVAAGKATTMGHIKRHHLNEALCAVPDSIFLSKADSIFDSILERQIGLGIQSRSLAATRDALLPGLVSGAVKV